MGQITEAKVVGADGTVTIVHHVQHVLDGDPNGLVELGYAYSPALIPPPLPTNEGMWRYRDLLPLSPGPILYPLPVGGTPLLALPGLRAVSGLPHLMMKTETRSPSGSNKDRATALVIEHALRQGKTAVTAASTGNVAVSTAIGAAAAGLRAMIFVPATVADGKLRLMLAAGATVFKVEEGYDAAFRLSRRASRAFGWVDRNTGSNPLTVEGKKTAAFEIWEQLDRQVPEVVVIPVGDGTTLTGIWKGFKELQACGVVERLPRLIGVQADGCHPLHCLFSGEEPSLSPGYTIADGICVDVPVNGVTALRDVKESGGAFVTVSDDAILRAVRTLAARGGVLAEPAGAAAFAALEPAVRAGLIDPRDRVVALVTGSGMKTPQFLAQEGQVHDIHGTLTELAEALHRQTGEMAGA